MFCSYLSFLPKFLSYHFPHDCLKLTLKPPGLAPYSSQVMLSNFVLSQFFSFSFLKSKTLIRFFSLAEPHSFLQVLLWFLLLTQKSSLPTSRSSTLLPLSSELSLQLIRNLFLRFPDTIIRSSPASFSDKSDLFTRLLDPDCYDEFSLLLQFL